MARPIDVISNAVHAKANRELAEARERSLNLPKGFVGEVLQSGGVVGIYCNLKSRERFGWTGCAAGGRILNQSAALRGLHGDSIVNSWHPNDDVLFKNTGLQTISCKLVDPDSENLAPYVYPTGDRDGIGVALDGAVCAEQIRERIAVDPLIVEAEILDSPWLTVSRLGLHAMIQTVHPDGYLAQVLPRLDDIVFEQTHLTKKESLAEWDRALTYGG